MRIIVTGGTGFVGRHVVRHALDAGMSVVATQHRQPPDHADAEWATVDIGNPAQVDDLIRRSGADAIINAAAALSATMAPLGACQNWRINAVAPVDVARSASRHGVRLVHVSSDAVFSGREEAYTESDLPDPTYPYGAAKAAAELGVATVFPEAALVRVSLIHGDGDEMANRDQHILDLAAGRVPGFYLTDAWRCPVGVNDLARALLELAAGDYPGVLNVAGPEAITFHNFARAVAEFHGEDPDRIPAATRAESGAGRPGRVILDTTRARQLLKTQFKGFSDMLAQPSTVAGVNL
jgi:dTDP-4-dehydrorhamnose reductase